MKNPVAHLVIMLFFTQLMAGLIGYYTSPSGAHPHIMAWYEGLQKSSLTPPGFVFGLVWPVLYALMVVSAWLVWRKNGSLKLFWWQLALNFAWSFVFFVGQYVGAAQILLLVILSLVAVMARQFYRQQPWAGYLLLPYILWLCLASYLNGFILLHN